MKVNFLAASNEQMWVIGIIHNSNKDFRLEVSKLRNSQILGKNYKGVYKAKKYSGNRWLE